MIYNEMMMITSGSVSLTEIYNMCFISMCEDLSEKENDFFFFFNSNSPHLIWMDCKTGIKKSKPRQLSNQAFFFAVFRVFSREFHVVFERFGVFLDLDSIIFAWSSKQSPSKLNEQQHLRGTIPPPPENWYSLPVWISLIETVVNLFVPLRRPIATLRLGIGSMLFPGSIQECIFGISNWDRRSEIDEALFIGAHQF